MRVCVRVLVCAQAGGLACLQDEGWAQMLGLIAFYKENAKILRCVWGGGGGGGVVG